VLAGALLSRPRFDVRLVRSRRKDDAVTPAVLVPGILGSGLFRPDGTQAWLNLGNTIGAHDLRMPLRLPLAQSRDDLFPAGLLGVDAVLPRLFGFSEYADLVGLLERSGFRRLVPGEAPRAAYHVFAYDWRRDLVEAARRLGDALDAVADGLGDRGARFNLIGHSMGGLIARYYLRFGGAEPGSPVTWAGARRIRHLVLVATPNAGAIPSLQSILTGNRVGWSATTLSTDVVRGMPAIYQLLPPPPVVSLLDHKLAPFAADLHDTTTWERFGFGPFSPDTNGGASEDRQSQRDFTRASLERARSFHEALARPPLTPCPVKVVMLGGDCLPTLARAIVPERPEEPLRFEPDQPAEAEAMMEAGDGRVTRASALASHVPGAEETHSGSGLPELAEAFFGAADHHGIYSEPTFQSVLLRLLLRPAATNVPPRQLG
jgi:pimeloyl-ACP methyl ester carboxylesterase